MVAWGSGRGAPGPPPWAVVWSLGSGISGVGAAAGGRARRGRAGARGSRAPPTAPTIPPGARAPPPRPGPLNHQTPALPAPSASARPRSRAPRAFLPPSIHREAHRPNPWRWPCRAALNGPRARGRPTRVSCPWRPSPARPSPRPDRSHRATGAVASGTAPPRAPRPGPCPELFEVVSAVPRGPRTARTRDDLLPLSGACPRRAASSVCSRTRPGRRRKVAS